jgi:hypothetical protein
VQQPQGVVVHAERRPALEAGVQRRTEGEDVALLRHLAAARDLGRQEGGGAGDLAGLGERHVVPGVGDAEVGDLDQTVDA